MSNLQLTRQSLRVLARHQSDPDLRSEKAFLMYLFGGPAPRDIFEILLDWLPHGKRKDGSIYKSDKELARETGYSTKTVERSRKILKEACFEIRVMKANGAPTNHYYFSLEKFLAFIAQKLHTSVEKVQMWLEGKAEPKDEKNSDKLSESSSSSSPDQPQFGVLETDRLSESERQLSLNEKPQLSLLELDKLAESLTGFNSNSQTSGEYTAVTAPDDAVVSEISLEEEINELHLKLGTSEADLRLWVTGYGLETVKAFTKQAVGNQGIYNKGGWVRQALIKNYQQNKSKTEMTAEEYGKSYTTGSKYADFIKH